MADVGGVVDTTKQVERLWETDPAFQAVCKQFGATSADEAWEMLFTREGVSKMSPDAADVHIPGAGANVRVRWGAQRPKGRRQHIRVAKAGLAFKAIPKLKIPKRTPGRPRKQMKPGVGALVTAGAGGAATLYGAQKLTKNPDAIFGQMFKPKNPDADIQPQQLAKSIDWEGTFSKVDEEKRQVFGWASIVSVDGEPVIDRQGDVIELDEIEKSAYDYVINSRTGGRQHKRTEDGNAFKASDMIESLVVTPEKKQHLGLTDKSPTGWWVGFKVHDDDTWAAVKRGEVTGFSIHGSGKRVPIEGEFAPERTEVA